MEIATVLRAANKLAGRIAPIYEMLDWSWRDEGIPTKSKIVEELLNSYKELTSTSLEGSGDSIETGGLVVHRYRDEEDVIHCIFEFRMKEEIVF